MTFSEVEKFSKYHSAMSSEDLTTVINAFIDMMIGQPADAAAENSSDSWICRFDCTSLSIDEEYLGVVERILSGNVAIVVVAKFDDKQVWENQRKDLARAVLFENILLPFYGTQDESEHEIKPLKEGDMVTVRVVPCDRKQGGIYNYYVSSYNKIGRKLEEVILSKVRDPLRGIVENFIGHNVGIIKFQTYSGNTLRATFSRENFYLEGLRVKDGPLSALVQKNSQVHLELSKWEMNEEMKEDVEGELDGKEIMLKATSVWLKGDKRPREQRTESDAVEKVPGEDVTHNEIGKTKGNAFDYDFTNYDSISDDGNLRGRLVCVEKDWGLVAVEEEVYVFYSSVAYIFGLKVELLPLNKIFFAGQAVELCLQEEKVTFLTFGTSLPPSMRKKAISYYCRHNSLSDAIKNSMEDLNKMQSQDGS